MPCGGISYVEEAPPGGWCFHCNEGGPGLDHFVEEWDAYLHGKCVEAFLTTDEGQTVVNHKHSIVLVLDGKTVIDVEEGQKYEAKGGRQ